MATPHRVGCACVVCTQAPRGKTHTKVCVSMPTDLWAAFSDECLLVGIEKSPTIAKLVALWLRHRKDKEKA